MSQKMCSLQTVYVSTLIISGYMKIWRQVVSWLLPNDLNILNIIWTNILVGVIINYNIQV